MKKYTLNKKGDIPVTILVIGVIAVCMMAILSFYFANQSVKNSFGVVEIVEKASISLDKILFYQNLGLSQSEIDKIFNVKSDVQGRYIYFEQEGMSVRYNLP